MIQIYYTHIQAAAHEALLRTYLPLFSVPFQRKVNRYRRWQDAQLSLLGRMLLWQGMENFGERYTDQTLQFTAPRKPFFKQSELQFNISHSGELVACAISKTGEIGIDVEWRVDLEIKDFKSQMTDREWQRVTTAKDSLKEFYIYWTEKEAVIKAQGEGLSIPLQSFEIFNRCTQIYGKSFFLRELSLDDRYQCFIATPYLIDQLPMKITAVDTITFPLTLLR